jgi:hypothetical protein
MSDLSQSQTTIALVNVSRLREELDLSFYMVGKLRKIGVIPPPFGCTAGCEYWRSSDLDVIAKRISEFRARKGEIIARLVGELQEVGA